MIPTVQINRWTLFFYVAHTFGCISVIGLVLITFFTSYVEHDAVGDFKLNLTSAIDVVFYVAAAFLASTVIIGFLAQRLADKPSLWILYCILLTIFALVALAASVSATSKAKTRQVTVHQLKISMEFYVTGTPNGTRWDKLHQRYHCCGVESYKDWQDVQFGRTSLRVPKTCCLPPNNEDDYCGLNILPHKDNASKYIYDRGCLEPAMKDMNTLLAVLGVMGLTVSATHMALAALSCYLVITKKV